MRETKAYKIGHIKGAISLPIEEIEKSQEKLRKDVEIIVYCGIYDCLKSDTASKKLVEMGFSKVKRYESGFKEEKELDYSWVGLL